jgi:2-keto-4-pentenoate hydratase/2-oxohepta-3-ene-1,7-dioic acid hydratase in catechol pathway
VASRDDPRKGWFFRICNSNVLKKYGKRSMKLASVEIDGNEGFGVIEGDSIRLAQSKHATLRDFLASGDELPSGGDTVAIKDATFLPVITNPSKIICVGVNYASHIAEMGREPGQYPLLFVRWAESQVGHGQPIIKPLESDHLDYEGELAVIIGKGGRRIKEEDALDAIAGYSIYNDGSVRDWQRHTTQFTAGKNFVATGGFGPWMVTKDEIPDPSTLTIETRLNGKVMQAAPISDLVFNVGKLLAYISTFTPLQAGDVIITGTTGGVGAARKPPVWMKDGDMVEVEVSNIGTLVNPVVAEV